MNKNQTEVDTAYLQALKERAQKETDPVVARAIKAEVRKLEKQTLRTAKLADDTLTQVGATVYTAVPARVTFEYYNGKRRKVLRPAKIEETYVAKIVANRLKYGDKAETIFDGRKASNFYGTKQAAAEHLVRVEEARQEDARAYYDDTCREAEDARALLEKVRNGESTVKA